MAITLDILENESINLSVDAPEVMALSVGETTVIRGNDYSDLINKPSIEGTQLNGDVSLNDLHGYTQEQINTLLSGKADTEDIPSLEGYATEQWVGQQGYLTEHQSLAGYATEQWVENKHYLTEHQSLDGYATEQYVDDAIEGIESGVISVNGQTGVVTLSIPSKTSDLTNDRGYITGYTETDPTVPSWAKASSKPTYTASEVGALPSSTVIPSKTSDLVNDSGFITGYTETDPTVPSWAKQSTKPSYTFSEIGAKPTSLSGYGIENAYTKSEVDGLVSGVLHYKGTMANTSLLPSSGNKTGDVWHITADGSEWAWDGTQWQELGTVVDLSGYVPTSRKINGNALTADIMLSIPTKTSDLTNDSGFITLADLPIYNGGVQ